MSWLPDIFSNSDGQTAAEAQANYFNEVQLYAAQLKRKLDDGKITEQFYQEQLNLLRQNAPTDPGDAAWGEFVSQVEENAKNLPSTIQDGIANTASYIGQTAGRTASGLGGGLSKGLFGNFAFSTTLIVLAVLSVVLWKPVLKPLLKKIIFIPV